MALTKESDIIEVSFLGENYQFPKELAQYVLYCNEFEKINDRLICLYHLF